MDSYGKVHPALFVLSSQSIIWNGSSSEMWDFSAHPETQEHSACPSSRACKNAFLLTLAYSRPPRQAKTVDSLQGTQTLLWAVVFQPPSRRTLQSLS